MKDFISREEEIKTLTNVVVAECGLDEESYVLSLNAKFGDGKTTFLKLWEEYIKKENYDVIYIDTWKDSFVDNALVSLCYSINTALLINKNKNFIKEKKKLVTTLKKISGYTTIFTSQFITSKLGIDAIKAQETLKMDKYLESFATKKFELFDLKRGLL